MYCRNCGQKMAEGDKFCSSCGAKVVAEDSSVASVAPEMPAVPAAAPEAKEKTVEDTPLFEPFDFKAFGFDFSELGLGTGIKEEEKPATTTEKFDWNTGEFPDRNAATKTEDVDFNWSLTPDEPVAPSIPEVKAPEVSMPEAPAAPEVEAPKSTPVEEPSHDMGLFGSLDNKADETRKQAEEIDKFYTFHHKNEEFQKILDREYEKVKSGNIIAEEMSAAEADAEEKFTARKPEDPMEELFASEGVVKVYEPKPVQTDVLERIEAAEEEKRVREEAARLVEQEREKARLEAEAAAKAEAEAAEKAAAEAKAKEEQAEEPVAVETVAAIPVIDNLVTESAPTVEAPVEPVMEAAPAQDDAFDIFAELESMDTIEEVAEIELPEETVTEPAPAIEVPAEPVAVEPAPAIEIPVEPVVEKEEPAAEISVADLFTEEVEPAPAVETPAIEIPAEPVAVEPVVVENIMTEEVPEKTKTVDKAAILAGMTIANEMVERDRAIAAEQAAAEAAVAEPTVQAAPIEATNIELPDFLGHEDAPAPAVEATPAEEPIAPAAEQVEEDVEFDIFEQLEKAEDPAEEIVLTDSQTLVDLFADAETETLQNHEKGFTEHTLILSEDSVAEILTASGEEVTEDTMLFSAETLGTILAEAENANPDAAEVVVSVESLTDVPPAAGAVTELAEEEEEEHQGGKGRVVLKVLLVVLIILLALEVTGVIIKIAAPTSGAANFIDNQLNKVFQLISGDDDKELQVFAEAEEIRTEPIQDKTQLIEAEKGKNKDGNIASIVYNQDLAFDPEKKYENTDLNLSQALADVAWYKNADNRQVYYDQAIVGTMIAYDSQRVNMVNGGDTTVLNLMIEGTDLYGEVSASASETAIAFESLEIGEIRQANSIYYVWVAETIDGTRTAYIYEMEPAGETMKIKARYEA